MRRDGREQRLSDYVNGISNLRSEGTLGPQGYAVLRFDAETGALLSTDGELMQLRNMAVPASLQELPQCAASWPIDEDFRNAAEEYFTRCAQADSPSIAQMALKGEEDRIWIGVSCARTTEERPIWTITMVSNDESMHRLCGMMCESQFDALTGVLTRGALCNAIENVLTRSGNYAIVMMDCDNFKGINDVYGHIAGDAALRELGHRLQNVLREGDMVGRIGGDEFLFLLRDVPDENTASYPIERVRKLIYETKDDSMRISASFGCALSPANGTRFEDLYRCADTAMYASKRRGGNCVTFFHEGIESGTAAEGFSGAGNPPEGDITLCLSEGVYTPSPRFAKTFDVDPNGAGLPRTLYRAGSLSLEGAHTMDGMLSHILTGENMTSCTDRFLIKTAGGAWCWYSVTFFRSGRDVLISFHDVSDDVNAARHYRRMAEYDELTGLYNRAAFVRYAQEQLRQNSEDRERGDYAIVYFDVLHFKAVNDLFGARQGDKLLVCIADALRKVAENPCIACRSTADRFFVLVHAKGKDLERQLQTLFTAVEHFDANSEIVCNAGIYVTDREPLSVEGMLDRAVLAYSSVKGSYTEKIGYYTEALRSAMLSEQEILSSMNTALTEHQFCAYFQPQYDHSDGTLVGAEALVRWIHPERGMLSPAVFIPIFERNGFISQLDLFVFGEVCRLQRQCLNAGMDVVPISVNLSRCDVYQSNFVNRLEELRLRWNVPVKLLRLEITESALVGGNQHISNVISQLHDKGYIVEMDDFGSGYSSLNVLKDIDMDVLKLDMRFISQSSVSRRGGTILSSVVRMASWMGLPVIAEGVERVEEADYLRSIGCNYIQGYFYARPMCESEFVAVLRNKVKGDMAPTLHLIENVNADKFWDPASQETLIFNNYVGGAAIFDYNGQTAEILRVNPKYISELEQSVDMDHLLHRDLLTLLDDANRQVYTDMLRRAIESGGEEECETWRTYCDSACCSLCIRASVRVLGSRGNHYLFHAMIRNITNEKNAVAEIMHREKIFRAAAEHANIYYWEYVVKSKESHMCFRCVRDLSLHPTEQNYPEPAITMGIFPADIADRYREMLRKIDAGAPEVEDDFPLTAARVPFHIKYTTEFDEEGRPLRAYGSAVPIHS